MSEPIIIQKARECFAKLITDKGPARVAGYISAVESGWHPIPPDFRDRISRLDFVRIGREEVLAFRQRQNERKNNKPSLQKV